MAITITTPAANTITVNETQQTVNVSTASSTITVATTGVASKAFYELTDVTASSSYTQGHLVSVGSDQKLRVRPLVQAATADARPIFEYANTGTGTSSSIVLRKNYGSGTFATNDGAGMRFEISDNARPNIEYAYLHVQYDPTSPSFILSTTNDDGATATTALKANKDLVTVAGDIRVNGNSILDSTGARAIDFTTDGGGNPIVKFDRDRTYGLTASNLVLDSRVEMNTSVLTTTATTTVTLDQWNAATTRSGKYLIQISCGSEYQMWEGMMIHNGTSSKITAYGDLRTSENNLAVVSTNYNSITGYVELKVTPTSATQTKFKAMKTLMYV